jgi:hypothetical protein
MIDVIENMSHSTTKLCMYHIRALTASGTPSSSFGRSCKPMWQNVRSYQAPVISAHKLMQNSCLGLYSIRGDGTVSVNKASLASSQLTARSGQSAQLVQCTRCIRTHVNLHSDFGHPCNGTRITWSLHDFILRAKDISRAFVYDDSLVSANEL